jgi:type VI secretion system protein VasG
LLEAIRPELLKAFKPALLGRMTVVPYYPISDSIMKSIIKLQLSRIAERVLENHKAQFSYDESVIETIAKRCTDVESGARNVHNIINNTLLPEMANEFLSRMVNGDRISKVHVSIDANDNFSYKIE